MYIKKSLNSDGKNEIEISQLIPSIESVASNYVFVIRDLLAKKGFKSNIYAIHRDPSLPSFVKDYKEYEGKEWDIMILHAAVASELTGFFRNLKCKKILVYHNHTPANFLKGINDEKAVQLSGYKDELRTLIGNVDKVLAVSEYNKLCLERIGFRNVEFSHLFVNFDRFEYHDQKTLEKFDDDYINIICVGRIVPNKKIEDVIRIFYYYKKFINEKSRLFLIGGVDDAIEYYIAILNYIEKLKLKDVIFIEECNEEELTSYYKLSDIFLYMSEHEGIGLPLIEAMYFKIHIIAFNAAAVPYTLGNSGLLVNEKDHKRVAELINLVLNDSNLKKKILDGQEERLKYFDSERLQERFMQHILELKKSFKIEKELNKHNNFLKHPESIAQIKILYIQPKGVGDIIMSTPVIRALKNKYPFALIDFAADDYCKYIVIGNPNINKIYSFDNLPDLQEYILVLRPYLKTQHMADWQNSGIHIVDLYSKLCGMKLEDYRTEIYPEKINLDNYNIQGDYICLHTESSLRSKDWPYFEELIKKLREEFKIVIIDEQQHNYPGTIQLPKNMKLTEKAFIVNKCKMLIGVDSMGIHMSCAFGVPTIAIYGNTLPELCRPLSNNNLITIKPKKRCTEGWHHKCKEDNYCIDNISVEEVLQKIEEILPKCRIY